MLAMGQMDRDSPGQVPSVLYTWPAGRAPQVWLEAVADDGSALPPLACPGAERARGRQLWRVPEVPANAARVSFRAAGPGGQTEARLGTWERDGRAWRHVPDLPGTPLRMLGLRLIDWCNLRCRMCGQVPRWERMTARQAVAGALRLPRLRSLLEEAAAMRPAVYLWGGEPFLHPDIVPLIRTIRELGMHCTINTNGTTLTAHAAALAEAPPDLLIVSVDGPPEVHEQIRRMPGLFRRVREGLHRLRQAAGRQVRIQINTVVLRENLPWLREMPAVAEDLMADALEFQLPMFLTPQMLAEYRQQAQACFGVDGASATGFLDDSPPPDPAEVWQAVCEAGRNARIPVTLWPPLGEEQVRTYFTQPARPTRSGCRLPWDSLWLEPDGRVVPCPDYPDVAVGDAASASLAEVRWGEPMRRFRRTLMELGHLSVCAKCCQLHQDFQPKVPLTGGLLR